jgi:hypothetical protein
MKIFLITTNLIFIITIVILLIDNKKYSYKEDSKIGDEVIHTRNYVGDIYKVTANYPTNVPIWPYPAEYKLLDTKPYRFVNWKDFQFFTTSSFN